MASVPLPNDIDGHEDQPTKPMVVSSMDCSSNIPMAVGGGAFPMPMTCIGISTDGELLLWQNLEDKVCLSHFACFIVSLLLAPLQPAHIAAVDA